MLHFSVSSLSKEHLFSELSVLKEHLKRDTMTPLKRHSLPLKSITDSGEPMLPTENNGSKPAPKPLHSSRAAVDSIWKKKKAVPQKLQGCNGTNNFSDFFLLPLKNQKNRKNTKQNNFQLISVSNKVCI